MLTFIIHAAWYRCCYIHTMLIDSSTPPYQELGFSLQNLTLTLVLLKVSPMLMDSLPPPAKRKSPLYSLSIVKGLVTKQCQS